MNLHHYKLWHVLYIKSGIKSLNCKRSKVRSFQSLYHSNVREACKFLQSCDDQFCFSCLSLSGFGRHKASQRFERSIIYFLILFLFHVRCATSFNFSNYSFCGASEFYSQINTAIIVSFSDRSTVGVFVTEINSLEHSRISSISQQGPPTYEQAIHYQDPENETRIKSLQHSDGQQPLHPPNYEDII